MNSINYEKNKEKILKNFIGLDLSDVNQVLDWFSNVQDFPSIYSNDEVLKRIVRYLNDTGYKTPENRRDILKLRRNLNMHLDQAKNNTGYFLISEILFEISNFSTISNGLFQLIDLYNFNYNKDKTINKMMDKLIDHKGDSVVVVYYVDSNRRFETKVLSDVDNNNSVILDGERIPFVGSGVGIRSIYSTEGEKLFENMIISDNYNEKDFAEVEKINQETFGKKQIGKM